jgi:hypothetical protein
VRWILPAGFGAVAVVGMALAFVYRDDATWLQVWIGVGLTFLTAAAVDAVALADAKRRADEQDARMAPVRGMIDNRLQNQQRQFALLVGVVLGQPLTGDLLQDAGDVRTLPNLKLNSSDLDTTLFPRLPRQQRMHDLWRELRIQQLDLETFAALGHQTEAIRGMSDLVLRSQVMVIIESFWATGFSYDRDSCKEVVADALDTLRSMRLSVDSPSA